MSRQETSSNNSIDSAISECDSYISDNRRTARLLLVLAIQLSLMALLGAIYLFVFLPERGAATSSPITTPIVSGILLLVSVLIGVLVSLYRFHLMEIARTEHYKIGFLRIRIAANNPGTGFGSEVRDSLTDGAFFYEHARAKTSVRVESPLPGHPTSDLSAALVGKLLEGIDIVVKPKAGASRADE